MSGFTIILGLTFLYFAFILGLVVYARIKETKQIMPGLGEFFLAGKNLPSAVLGLTFVASLFSAFAALSLPGYIYTHGINGFGFLIVSDLVGIIILLTLGKRLWRFGEKTKIYSPIEAVSHQYNSRALGLFIAIFITIFMMPYISLQLVGIGKFIESYTDGQVGYLVGVGSMMAVVILYLFLGGMRAVAYTDFLQYIAIFVGLYCGLYYFFKVNDLGVIELFTAVQETNPDYFSFGGAKDFYTIPMFMSMFIVIAGLFFQPHLLTRPLMASREKDINAICYYLLLSIVLITITSVGFGFGCLVVYGPDIAPNLIMGHIFKDIAATGLTGVILSGLMLMGALGASMSTADSLLISIGQIGTRDVIRPYFKMKPKKQVLLSKAIMLVVLGAAFVIGINPPKLMGDLALYTATGCALLAPTFLFFEWKYAHKYGAFISIGLGTSALFAAALYKAHIGEHPFGVHVGTIPLALSFVSYYLVCLIMKAKGTSHAKH